MSCTLEVIYWITLMWEKCYLTYINFTRCQCHYRATPLLKKYAVVSFEEDCQDQDGGASMEVVPSCWIIDCNTAWWPSHIKSLQRISSLIQKCRQPNDMWEGIERAMMRVVQRGNDEDQRRYTATVSVMTVKMQGPIHRRLWNTQLKVTQVSVALLSLLWTPGFWFPF